jgi:hypothetical protein
MLTRTFEDHFVFAITVRNGKLTKSGSMSTRKHCAGLREQRYPELEFEYRCRS